MRALWGRALGIEAGTVQRSKARRWLDLAIARCRRHRAYQGILQNLKWKLAPNIFGLGIRIALVLLILALPLTAIQRVRLAMAERSNQICAPEWAGGSAETSQGPDHAFATKFPCSPVGRVTGGQRYELELAISKDWADGAYKVRPDQPERQTLPAYVRYSGLPFRRFLTHSWYEPLLKIVPTSQAGSPHVSALKLKRIDRHGKIYGSEFVAAQSGDLYLLVNDAIVTPWGFTRWFYDNNDGIAQVSIDPPLETPIAPQAQADGSSARF